MKWLSNVLDPRLPGSHAVVFPGETPQQAEESFFRWVAGRRESQITSDIKSVPVAYDSSFRALNMNEQRALNKLREANRLKDARLAIRAQLTEDLEVSYQFLQGGFCVCIIVCYEQPARKNSPRYIAAVYRGASRRSYKDAPNIVKGEMQSFCRALKCSRGVEL